MTVHPLLEKYYKRASCAPERCKQRRTTCTQFTQCGTSGLCPNPCELCSFWTGCGMKDHKIKDCIKKLNQEETPVGV